MSYLHGIIWLDHRHASVHGLSTTGERSTEPATEGPSEWSSEWSGRELHHHLADSRPGHPIDVFRFFDEIASSLDGIRDIVITGPGMSKTAFASYLRERYPRVAERVVGVETLDHQTGPELVAYAKRYFHSVDELGLTGEVARRGSPQRSMTAGTEPAALLLHG